MDMGAGSETPGPPNPSRGPHLLTGLFSTPSRLSNPIIAPWLRLLLVFHSDKYLCPHSTATTSLLSEMLPNYKIKHDKDEKAGDGLTISRVWKNRWSRNRHNSTSIMSPGSYRSTRGGLAWEEVMHHRSTTDNLSRIKLNRRTYMDSWVRLRHPQQLVIKAKPRRNLRTVFSGHGE